jgi:hypothetical protein
MINQFKSQFDDIARLNRFRFECGRFSPASTFILAATLPGESWNTENQRDPDNLGAIPYGLPVDIIQNDVAVTFINDNMYTTRTVFDAWWKEIFDSGKNKGFGYWQDYKTDVKIIALDRQNRDTYEVTLKDAYPVQYSDINFDSNPEAGLSTFTVTFKYGDILKKAVGQSSGGLRRTGGEDTAFDEILRGILGSI